MRYFTFFFSWVSKFSLRLAATSPFGPGTFQMLKMAQGYCIGQCKHRQPSRIPLNTKYLFNWVFTGIHLEVVSTAAEHLEWEIFKWERFLNLITSVPWLTALQCLYTFLKTDQLGISPIQGESVTLSFMDYWNNILISSIRIEMQRSLKAQSLYLHCQVGFLMHQPQSWSAEKHLRPTRAILNLAISLPSSTQHGS